MCFVIRKLENCIVFNKNFQTDKIFLGREAATLFTVQVPK